VEIKTYFFDTYAFYELIGGNESYSEYCKDIAIITTKLNLMGLHYGLMREYGKEVADKLYDELVKFTVGIED